MIIRSKTKIGSANSMNFSFKHVLFKKKIIRETIERATNAIFSNHDISKFDISFLITNDSEIRKINHEFRDMDKPTDVLSFPSSDDCDGDTDGFYGDIIISIRKAKSQAKEFGQPFERELMFLTIHGCLHLLGYDHLIKDDEMKMREKQREILDLIVGENK